jgi:hypothetical protein
MINMKHIIARYGQVVDFLIVEALGVQNKDQVSKGETDLREFIAVFTEMLRAYVTGGASLWIHSSVN